MRVVILAEAGPAVGLGHLTRSVALYDALEDAGSTCELIVAGEAPAHAVDDRRVSVCEWREAANVAALLSGADCAVIDSYQAGEDVYREASASTKVAVYFDDTARMCYPRGIIVNGMPEADSLGFGQTWERGLLSGARYQVIRSEFRDAPAKTIQPRVRSLLVIAGGTDATGARAAMAAAAADAYPGADIDVIGEPRTAAAIRQAMAEADIAVSAAGQSLYELAALGTPTVALCVADNQLAQACALERAGTLLLAGDWREPGAARRVSEALVRLADVSTRAAMSRSGRRLIDGRGARRVARECLRAVIESRADIRAATDADERELLDLANDPVVRGMSFTKAPIDANTHSRWLRRAIADPSRLLLVARDRGELFGQARFDIAPAREGCEEIVATVSVSVTPRYRGTGAADVLIERAVAALRCDRPEVTLLEAHVRLENAASRALFERADFALADGREGIATPFSPGTAGVGPVPSHGSLVYRRRIGVGGEPRR